MTVIRPHGSTLNGAPANPRRQRDRTPATFWPTGADGDAIYHQAPVVPWELDTPPLALDRDGWAL